jgi:hypothetical protein
VKKLIHTLGEETDKRDQPIGPESDTLPRIPLCLGSIVYEMISAECPTVHGTFPLDHSSRGGETGAQLSVAHRSAEGTAAFFAVDSWFVFASHGFIRQGSRYAGQHGLAPIHQ